MAAELSTLVASFLDTNPQIYAPLFLECVNSKRHLNNEKIPDDWIGKVHTFLNSKTDSWLGVCLLGVTIEQCDTDTFTKHCASWLRTILQIIQTQERPNITQYCSILIDKTLQYAVEFSELSRELANSVLPTIISTMLSKKCSDISSVLSILSSCVCHFPGPTGPFRNQIENFLLPLLNSTCENTRKDSCHCYAVLPRCSQSSSSGKRQLCPWGTQWNKIVSTIHKLLDAAYENVEPVSSDSSQESTQESETLLLGEIPQVEPGRTYTLVTRCMTLLQCLSVMIREQYFKVVTVPVEATINLVNRIIAVTTNSLKNAVIVESVLLRASIPLIHTSAVDLLSNIITRCRGLILPHCDSVVRMLIQELTWTKQQNPSHGQDKSYRKLRCSVYLCIERLVQLTRGLPEGGGVVAKLVQQMLDDIKPMASQTKLLPTTSTGHQQMSKKAKKRKLQDDVDQLLTGQQKFDTKANEMVTYRALRALSAVLIASGNDIPQGTFREIQVYIIRLIIQCQQSPYDSFPIPFSSPDCRQALYHILQCCLLVNSPNVPSPVNHAVRLFSEGLQDADLKVSSFCQEALAVANSIIHPRSFPQVCSAAGPLSLSTSEHHPSNGPLSTDFDQSSSVSVTSRSLVQTGSGNSLPQQSILSRGSFENSNGVGYSEIGQNSLRYTEKGQATESSDVNSSLTSVRNISEEYEHHTFQKSSVNQNETSNSQVDHCILTDNASQLARIQASTSSSDSSMPQLLNQEGFIDANKSKTVSENTAHEREQRDVTTSFFQSAVLHDTHNTFGSSEPKRRRADDSCIGSDQMLNDKQREGTTTSEEQWIGHTRDKEREEREAAATNEDNAETFEMLASFVDSYPDSD
ncbi:unnamed protein product [Porites evermanni]|uniref:Pre-rRNA-processing protein RIX1 N-terminal domain-containing protein n=1 Tax=Porites evermanni TaxID=104178 RepID=A0ABN8M3I3_9CNID|nr:unnamed protein product [Porites evermanni]